MTPSRWPVALLALIAAPSAFAAEPPALVTTCATIADDAERLACYDRLAAQAAQAAAATPATDDVADVTDAANPAVASAPTPAGPAPQAQVGVPSATADTHAASDSYLSRYWELDDKDKLGTFLFRLHRDTYLIATYNPDPNDAPYRPLQRDGHAEGLSEAELKYQISFKLKLLETPADLPVDVWFGYTQTSFWQAGNRRASSPFRESNYQPELMAVVPMDVNLLGLHLRYLNAGVVHESNGQGALLSRSWNRAYLQAGFERGRFTLLARAWKRLHESADEDDNPDITDYMGHGDLYASWRDRGHEVSLLTRYNGGTGRGAAQLSWAFPLASHLKGYVQYFDGYGHSLIDYNVSQRVVGAGIQVDY